MRRVGLRALMAVVGPALLAVYAGVASVQRRVGRVVMVGVVAHTLVVLAHSRRREYAPDDRAAAVTGDPLALTRAPRKIERATKPRWAMSSPLYVRGDEEGRVSRLLSTHPEMDERIGRLVERADRERGVVSIAVR